MKTSRSGKALEVEEGAGDDVLVTGGFGEPRGVDIVPVCEAGFVTENGETEPVPKSSGGFGVSDIERLPEAYAAGGVGWGSTEVGGKPYTPSPDASSEGVSPTDASLSEGSTEVSAFSITLPDWEISGSTDCAPSSSGDPESVNVP